MSNVRRHKNLDKKNARAMLKRQARQAKVLDENTLKLHGHIEAMLAAYMKETSIPANVACLVHETETTKDAEGKETKTVKYWFEHHENRVKLADTHPDVQYLFDLGHEIWRAFKLDEGKEYDENLREGLELLDTFMQKYDGIIDAEVKKLVKGEENDGTE